MGCSLYCVAAHWCWNSTVHSLLCFPWHSAGPVLNVWAHMCSATWKRDFPCSGLPASQHTLCHTNTPKHRKHTTLKVSLSPWNPLYHSCPICAVRGLTETRVVHGRLRFTLQETVLYPEASHRYSNRAEPHFIARLQRGLCADGKKW